jgi:nicotinate phosphoribosyltransferase
VMAFEEEEEAFLTYAKILPDSSVLLVDTYDTLSGVEKAIQVGKWLQSRGKKLVGIRLDSGDLAQLSIESRKMLDKAGFTDAKIIASNELDEIVISELKRQGAKISAWGVGTSLVTGKDQAALDGVYKLSALQEADGSWKYTLKLSEQLIKVSNPGQLQVKRYRHNGYYVADLIYDLQLGIAEQPQLIDPFDHTKQVTIDPAWEADDMLIPIFCKGCKVYESPFLEDIRKKTYAELACLPTGVKRFLNPHVYAVGLEKELYQLKVRLIRKIRGKRRVS